MSFDHRRRKRAGRSVSALLAVCTIAAALLAGCGGGGSDDSAPTTTTRPVGDQLNSDEVDRLAQVLFANYRAKGASVVVSAVYEDLSLSIEGEVDWANHEGALAVTAVSGDGRSSTEEQVVFTEDTVFDPISAEQTAVLDGERASAVEWVSRPPDVENRPIDQLIAMLVALAATEPDNPQLIAQRGMTYGGSEEVDGRPATRFDSADTGARYWLNDETGRLARFQGSLPGFTGPIVVDITDHGSVEVPIPTDEATIGIDEFG